MKNRRIKREIEPSRTMIISTEQAESFHVRFDIACLNANFDPLLKKYSNNEFQVKMEFFEDHILYTLIDRESKEKEPRIGYIKDEYTRFFNLLETVLTFGEACERWNLGSSTLRKAQQDSRFHEGEIRKSGGTWLVTKSAMERLYGDQS